MWCKIIVAFLLCNQAYGMELKKVLVLGRHNVRTPLISISTRRMTPMEWPKWDEEAGDLTLRGALLESYMGEYFSGWLKYEGLLTDPCPKETNIYIYANTKQRTKASAESFAEAAFKNCNVTVHFKNSTEMDPIFNPVVHNTTKAFGQLVKQEILDRLEKINIKDVYLALNDLLDLKNSPRCKEEGYCDLSKHCNDVIIEAGVEPKVLGPFSISVSIVDSFLMSYYEGLPLNDVGWGKIKDERQWELLTKIIKENQHVRFNSLTVSRDLTKPLINFMKERLETDTKFTLLVGHDSNLSPLLTYMEFKPFVLPEQFELTPIGSMLVFQKWSDGKKDFLKIELMYQSWQQLRNAEKLSFDNPPKNITLYLKFIKPYDNGFYSWNILKYILNGLLD